MGAGMLRTAGVRDTVARWGANWAWRGVGKQVIPTRSFAPPFRVRAAGVTSVTPERADFFRGKK
jgi:hypothetical protein